MELYKSLKKVLFAVTYMEQLQLKSVFSPKDNLSLEQERLSHSYKVIHKGAYFLTVCR